MTVALNSASIARFWAHVVKTDGCWIWKTAGARKDGKPCYGSFRRASGQGNSHVAHRVCWEIVNGAIPECMIIIHRCDNPRCVNPDHLRLGTRKDNMQDMITKGRARWQRKLEPVFRITHPSTLASDDALGERRPTYGGRA